MQITQINNNKGDVNNSHSELKFVVSYYRHNTFAKVFSRYHDAKLFMEELKADEQVYKFNFGMVSEDFTYSLCKMERDENRKWIHSAWEDKNA